MSNIGIALVVISLLSFAFYRGLMKSAVDVYEPASKWEFKPTESEVMDPAENPLRPL